MFSFFYVRYAENFELLEIYFFYHFLTVVGGKSYTTVSKVYAEWEGKQNQSSEFHFYRALIIKHREKGQS